MVQGTPEFRRDLTVRTQQTAGGTVSIVKDPVSGQYFRMREAELFIARQFDGATSFEVVRRRTEEAFGATLPAATLSTFVERLAKNRLLESEDARRQRPNDPSARVRGNWLYLRFNVFDPSAFFERLLPKVRFLYTPYFVVLSFATIVLAVATLLANWGAYVGNLHQLYRLATVPVFLIVSCLVVSLHEAAHGLTCTRYGGVVRETGFMFIYFNPALYCNVSDAWLFPEKSKRLWVGFAGPYFELFIWALATLTWRATESDTLVSYLALIVMTGSGIKTLMNFNPLIKLDGYYLLSDYLEIPNLRRKSFRLVGGHVKRLFGLGDPPAMASRREWRICLVYGLTATLGSLAFLGIALITVGNLLFVTGHQFLLLLFSGLAGLKLRRRFQRLFGRSSGSVDDEDDDDESGDEVKTSAAHEGPKAVPIRRKSRKKRRWPMRVAWGAIVAAALAFLFLGRMELRIAGSFDVRPLSNADVRSAVAGIIEEVYVNEGDRVAAGDPIARLSDKDLRVELLKTEAEIKEAGAGLGILVTGPTAQQIEVARAAVATEEDQIAYTQSRLKRSKILVDQGLLSEQQYEDHKELATTAENRFAEAQARLRELLTSVRPEQIQGTMASIERLSMQRKYLDAQLRLSNVVSPAAGIVATPARELKELHGRLVQKGDLIAKVFDFETVTAYIAISEKEIADVQLGQKVVLRTRAYPDTNIYGTVTSIGTSATSGATSGSEFPLGATDTSSSGGTRTILVTTQIDNRSGLLKPEMTGLAKVLCGERRIVDLLVRRVARTLKVEFWSWW